MAKCTPCRTYKTAMDFGSSKKFADFDSFWPYERTYKVAMDFGTSRNIADFDSFWPNNRTYKVPMDFGSSSVVWLLSHT